MTTLVSEIRHETNFGDTNDNFPQSQFLHTGFAFTFIERTTNRSLIDEEVWRDCVLLMKFCLGPGKMKIRCSHAACVTALLSQKTKRLLRPLRISSRSFLDLLLLRTLNSRPRPTVSFQPDLKTGVILPRLSFAPRAERNINRDVCSRRCCAKYIHAERAGDSRNRPASIDISHALLVLSQEANLGRSELCSVWPMAHLMDRQRFCWSFRQSRVGKFVV